MSKVYNVVISKESDLMFLGTFSSKEKAMEFAKKFPSPYGYLSIAEVELDKAYLVDIDVNEGKEYFGTKVKMINKDNDYGKYGKCLKPKMEYLTELIQESQQKKLKKYKEYVGVCECKNCA